MNRFGSYLVRERNRLFIGEVLWQQIEPDLAGEPHTRDLLLRFATSPYDDVRLLAAARTGRLIATFDRSRRAWMATQDAVRRYRSECGPASRSKTDRDAAG